MSLAMPLAVAPPAGAWRRQLGVLAAVTAALLLLFARDMGALARLWWTSTTFGHCLFIGPVVAWLVWQRRGALATLTPVGWAPGLGAVALGALVWWMGDAASVALLRQLGLLAMVEGAVIAVLGPQVARALLFPLAYAWFLVPFGDQLEAPLQDVTVALVLPMLALAGVPASVDGVVIHAGRYWFEVAEACSGAKFVLAMLPFGVLIAHLCFRRWQRRAVFMAVAIIVPVLANGVRAFATIYAANLTSVEAATGFDHIVYGWVFFAAVMAGVLALGWRWFDRAPDDAAVDLARIGAPPARAMGPVRAAAGVLVAPLLVLGWSAAAARPAAVPARIDLPVVPGWQRVPIDTVHPWSPWHPGADHRLFGRYRAGDGAVVDVGAALFAQQAEGRELVAFGTGVLREDDRWVRVADLAPVAGGSAMRIVAPGPVERVVATWYRVGDATTSSPLEVKLLTLRQRVLARPLPALALHIATPGRDPAPIARFIAAMGGIDAGAAAIEEPR